MRTQGMVIFVLIMLIETFEGELFIMIFKLNIKEDFQNRFHFVLLDPTKNDF